MRAPSVLLFVLAPVVVLGGTAYGDLPPASRWVGAPVLPAGDVTVSAVHELRLSRFRHLPDEVGDPWSDGIDVAVALDARLTLGVSHSARSRGTVDHGGGWCHDGPAQRCDAAYAGALVDARWRVSATARRELVALARIGVADLSPVRPVVRLGLSGRRAHGRFWGVVEPEFQIAFGHREAGNRDQLIAPVWIGVGRRRAAAWVMSGVRSDTVGFGEKFEIPFMLGGAVAFHALRVGAEAGFPQLAGPQNTGNVRHAAVWVGARF